MISADSGELIAEIILQPHQCGPRCLCREIRRLPVIAGFIRKLQAEKLEQDLATEAGSVLE